MVWGQFIQGPQEGPLQQHSQDPQTRDTLLIYAHSLERCNHLWESKVQLHRGNGLSKRHRVPTIEASTCLGTCAIWSYIAKLFGQDGTLSLEFFYHETFWSWPYNSSHIHMIHSSFPLVQQVAVSIGPRPFLSQSLGIWLPNMLDVLAHQQVACLAEDQPV